ncbi:MAG: peptidoglycan DD-metalloendopeptidase family protein [Rhodocyclaceae bacterium]|nr:peptidoglycan DD-metalloendopeptidase family protein [Rhodocyclaceae bacterium]
MTGPFAIAALALACLLPLSAAAAPSPADQKKAELADLKGRIESLRDEVARSEASRADVVDQLRETERAISETGRKLRDLAQAQGAAQEDMAKLQKQARALQQQIDLQQTQLGNLLHRQYQAGDSDALSRFLGGEDPNQPARDAYYLRALSQAKGQWISGLRHDLEEKSRLADAVKAKSGELADIEARSRDEQAELLIQQQKHRTVLQKIATTIKSQRREMSSLKRDETRLAKLLQGLARIVRRPPPARPPIQAAETGGTPEVPSAQVKAAPAETPETPPFVSPTGVSFANLKGHLRTPLQGTLAHRFGSRRADGATTWKGLFIRAASGDVSAVAAGRVVFADWLRGFGNLLILDHGDEYLTVYGNNETLYKGVGDRVAAGDAIAAVGSSGGNAETGLYFELRFQGQALDPLKWLPTKLGR